MFHRILAHRLLAAAAFAVMFALPASAQQTIVLDGSTGMIPLARAIAQAYAQSASDPRIEIGQGLGTSARVKALADGKIDVALASHGLQAADLEKNGLRAVDIAKGAIVFAVNASVPLSAVTEQQVCDVFSGKATGWKALGGPDVPIVVLTRPPTEVDPEVVRAKLACFRDLKEADSVRVMARGSDMAKGLAETPNAIGMTSMTVVEQSGGRIRALSLDGVTATPANVRSGQYGLTRDFLFVMKARPSAEVTRFLDFVRSPAGDRVIMESGAIPLR